MTDFEPVAHEPHSLYGLISWPAVIAGAAVAVAAGAMLELLGAALGASGAGPFGLAPAGGRAFTVGAGLWMALANILALFAGGLVASRAANHDDRHHGMLHGLMVWALAFVAVIFLSGTGMAGPAGAADVAANVADPAAPADAAPAGTLQSDGSIAPSDAAAALPNAALATPTPRAPASQKTADPAEALALWSFLTMLLGAAGAVFGGRYGARKHAWESRAPRHDPNTPHLPPRL